MLNRIIRFFLENKLVTFLLVGLLVAWGIVTSPFGWKTFLPSDPVPVDAIPDIGENQQIVFTDWMGRSPQDVENQITYPLTTSLLGIPGVKSIRSTSMFGFSTIFIIFDEDVEFYWSRSRILEKLNSLPTNLLPEGVQPALGPDATALGQVFWYTLEGRDSLGNPTGGWDLHEIRTVQDFYVKYALNAVEGVSEVASIGGQIREYQIDVNPAALRAYNIPLMDVMTAVKNANRDAGAQTIEINQAEYLVRGLGYVKKTEDLEKAVVAVQNNVPVRISDIAVVNLGPETRRGLLDKEGAEVAGGVVVARFGSNPLAVIDRVKEKIKEIAPGLPQKKLADGRVSRLTVVPFYDRTQLIHETLGTLERALSHEILITIIVVIVLVLNLRASLIISSMLPLAVLATFIAMRYFGVDANIVALSGIAIAIGVMVDVGIVFVENIIRHLEMPENQGASGRRLLEIIYGATVEVSSAITTALATTVVSFLPVFAMEAAEGKLFKPLAFTKTFALGASFVLGIVVLPALAHLFFNAVSTSSAVSTLRRKRIRRIGNLALVAGGILLAVFYKTTLPIALTLIGLNNLITAKLAEKLIRVDKVNEVDGAAKSTSLTSSTLINLINIAITLLVALFFLTEEWVPLGHHNSLFVNFLFVLALLGLILGALLTIVHFYQPILRWCLENKGTFLILPVFTVLFGLLIWLGWRRTMGWAANGFDKIGWNIRTTEGWSFMLHKFPGLGKEFMPSLDEGSFLLMPTSMPHSGVEENKRVVQQLDMLLANIPEVELAVGKAGRAESALDPAPVSMFENVINYKPEFLIDENGKRLTFKTDKKRRFLLASGDTLTNEEALLRGVKVKDLIPDPDGQFYRNWRPAIKNPDDIWDEIVRVTKLPGVTSAPKLQPIETRLVMLQTGMRAPMGIKVYGPDLATIERFGLQLEAILKQVPSVKSEAAFADRIVGTPYLQLNIDRDAIARYGLSVEDVQQFIEAAIGGMAVTRTVEGRERFPVRVRYPRELRDDPEKLKKMLVPTKMMGAQVPLGELVKIEYVRGPQMIKSEETFLVGYVLFDKKEGYAEVDAVNEAQRFIQQRIESGELVVPAGVSFKFSGNYENQVRATKRLAILIPFSLLLVFLLLFFQFRTVTASCIHFSGVFVAFAGGFIMLWLWGQDWFMNFSIAEVNMRELFQMHPINLSVAVWVGFIALFGIATDDGVIMGTYIHQVFEERKPTTVAGVRAAVLEAGKKRVRPAMMTAATAIIALLPVLTSTGKGADIMVPMAIPTFGGMVIQLMTMFVVPVLQTIWRENAVGRNQPEGGEI